MLSVGGPTKYVEEQTKKKKTMVGGRKERWQVEKKERKEGWKERRVMIITAS